MICVRQRGSSHGSICQRHSCSHTGALLILSSSYNISSAAFPGKNLAFITEKAISMVKSDPAGYSHTLNPAFVYITAGLTDLTEKVTYGTGSNRYQEVIFYR